MKASTIETAVQWKPIGEFIESVKVKNTDGLYDDLQGINIDKFFIYP